MKTTLPVSVGLIISGIINSIIKRLRLYEKTIPTGCVYAYAIHLLDKWLSEDAPRRGVEVYLRRDRAVEKYSGDVLFSHYDRIMNNMLRRFLEREECSEIGRNVEALVKAIEDTIRYIRDVFLVAYDHRGRYTYGDKLLAALHIFSFTIPTSDHRVILHLNEDGEIKKIEIIHDTSK